MRNYEIVLIFRNDIGEEARVAGYERLTGIIEDGGKVTEVAEWGARRLAYEIDDLKDGYYYIVSFEAEPEAIENLERRCRITDGLLRFMVVRQDD